MPAPNGKTAYSRLLPKQKRLHDELIIDGNTTRAYIAAGYKVGADGKPNRQAVYAATHKPTVLAALEETRARREAKAAALEIFSRDWVRDELDRVKKLAEKKEDFSAAIRALELIGKSEGMFKDGLVVESARTRELTAAEQAEADAFADFRLQSISTPAPKQLESVIDVDCQAAPDLGADAGELVIQSPAGEPAGALAAVCSAGVAQADGADCKVYENQAVSDCDPLIEYHLPAAQAAKPPAEPVECEPKPQENRVESAENDPKTPQAAGVEVRGDRKSVV